MSLPLINHSPDLKKLQDEGYDIEIQSAYLLVKNVPYVNAQRELKWGVLVSELTMAGDVVAIPGDHVVSFSGEYPCDKNGAELTKIVAQTEERRLDDKLIVHHKFSSKPVGDGKYKDYYEKMTAYIAILSSHAQAIDPQATAKTFPVITTKEDESVFKYLDTASSRAEINMVTKKLELGKVAIIGVGGTGSYVLDLVAKTPVREIHLFDGDDFLSHNAFRAPSAASVEELRVKPKKVSYLNELYSKMRRGIFSHEYHIDPSNIVELQGIDFV